MTELFPPIQGGLASKNAHPRDSLIQFFEADHKYEINGDPDFTSCTTFINQFFIPFDADRIIQKLLNKPNKYHGMTAKEIQDSWAEKGKLARDQGTLLHNFIEYYFNNLEATLSISQPPEYQTQFKAFLQEIVLPQKLIPYRTEWCVFHEEYKLAGSIDMIFQLDPEDDTNLVIYDWKRSPKLSIRDNKYQNMLPPLQHLPDTSYWHYCLQLNIYRHILETKYGKNIVRMCLLALHPDLENYQLEEVPFLREEIKSIFSSL